MPFAFSLLLSFGSGKRNKDGNNKETDLSGNFGGFLCGKKKLNTLKNEKTRGGLDRAKGEGGIPISLTFTTSPAHLAHPTSPPLPGSVFFYVLLPQFYPYLSPFPIAPSSPSPKSTRY